MSIIFSDTPIPIGTKLYRAVSYDDTTGNCKINEFIIAGEIQMGRFTIPNDTPISIDRAYIVTPNNSYLESTMTVSIFTSDISFRAPLEVHSKNTLSSTYSLTRSEALKSFFDKKMKDMADMIEYNRKQQQNQISNKGEFERNMAKQIEEEEAHETKSADPSV